MKRLALILILFSSFAFAQKQDSAKKQLGLIVKTDVLISANYSSIVASYAYTNIPNNVSYPITNNFQANIQTMGGGFSNGFQYYLFKRITLDLLVGLGVRKQIKIIGPIVGNNGVEFIGRFALNIGYKF